MQPAEHSLTTDFYGILAQSLSPEERALHQKLRSFLETEVQPLLTDYWQRDEFPMHIIPKFAETGAFATSYKEWGCHNLSFLMDSVLIMEYFRTDGSIGTFASVHAGLAMGSLYHCGSEEQKAHWMPKLRTMSALGAFALTEPDVGSAVARGMKTTCRKDGEYWVLNGEKKWIGNATFADVVVVWARDEATNHVKGFLVERGTPGFHTEKILNKGALRLVQNAHITLNNCAVPETHRLQGANTFADVAKVLMMARVGVAWQAVGCAMGAFEHAVQYTLHREQFGKPIAAYQLVQQQLAEMLANITAMQTLCIQASKMYDTGTLTDAHASLAKMFCSAKVREVVAAARGVLGGNGILLDHHVMRYFTDAEAIYSYEGTYEMNALIVGRSITGLSAFV